VFVSSTFRDMLEDRNELMAQTWPALRKVCRSRAVEFVEVDLRWGVTEEQSQRKETVRHCLAEIKRCRPYFIGLLGERYGWVPGPETFSPALLDEEPWLDNEVAKRSVTEIEILHGVLNDPDMAGRSFFYFRDPKYAKTRGGDFLPEDAASAARQDELKQRVKKVCEAKHIPLCESYADPPTLDKLVLADLTAAIEAEFPEDQSPDVWAREDREHEAYARSRRTEFYVGRDAYFQRLDDYARNGGNGCGLTVLGASGGGKSALLANWAARWRQAHAGDFVFQHYIGSSPMSASHLALMRRLMVAIIRWLRDEDAPREFEPEEGRLPAQAEEIVKAFPGYLDRLAVRAREKGVRAIVVLDALNQLEDRERGRLLAWLPRRLPGEVRLIASTLPGDAMDALERHNWPDPLTVEPLTEAERIQLIARYLSHFSQGLSEARAWKIAAVEAASNPLYIKTLLDDLRVTGAHERLDEQIDDYLRAAGIPALLTKILARYERDYQRDRPELVREALALLWAARRGLTEPELLELLKPDGLERLPAGLWSPVRCALEDGLVDRDGVLSFAHDHLRTAVERRYVREPGAAKALRLRLADYFGSRPVDARQADEFPWLLRQTESRDRLRACLLDIDRFQLIQNRDGEELLGYWVWLREERGMGALYLKQFERWALPKGEWLAVNSAAGSLAYFLLKGAQYIEAENLLDRVLETGERFLGAEHPSTLGSVNNLAFLYERQGRYGEAEPLYQRALAARERVLGAEHPDTLVSVNNLAGLYERQGRYGEAEPLYQRALEGLRRKLGDAHPHTKMVAANHAGCLDKLRGGGR
jgi:nephrocystin-3